MSSNESLLLKRENRVSRNNNPFADMSYAGTLENDEIQNFCTL